MKQLWRDNGLSLTLFGLFLLFLVGQALTGWRDEVNDLSAHGRPAIRLVEYLGSGAFLEATMENWESEFLADVSVRDFHSVSVSEGFVGIEGSKP